MAPTSVPFELDALAGAPRYQRWIASVAEPYLGERILEIGAGIGNLSAWLPRRQRLVLSEAEPALLQRLAAAPWAADRPEIGFARIDLESGAGLASAFSENFDTIVSFNVLEHLRDDEAAILRLAEVLRASAAPGPRRLVSFVPAHTFAFGAIDRAFGHVRRYDRERVRALASRVAPEAKLAVRSLNLFGLPGWIVAGRLLRRRRIGRRVLAGFEAMLPVLAPLDDLLQTGLKLRLGQSLLFVLTWSAR